MTKRKYSRKDAEKREDDERVNKEILQLTGIFAADPHLKPDFSPECAVSTHSLYTDCSEMRSSQVKSKKVVSSHCKDTTRDKKPKSYTFRHDLLLLG